MKELTQDLELNQIPYLILTDKGFKDKLQDLNIKVDYIVDTKLNDPPKVILDKFYEVIKKIDYSFLIKFGARIAGPSASRRLGKPYLIVDGGLPDYMSRKDDLYNKKVVLRNRFKRLLREAYRKTKHLLLPGYDIVILATNIKKNTKSSAVEEEIANAFKKCIKK